MGSEKATTKTEYNKKGITDTKVSNAFRIYSDNYPQASGAFTINAIFRLLSFCYQIRV